MRNGRLRVCKYKQAIANNRDDPGGDSPKFLTLLLGTTIMGSIGEIVQDALTYRYLSIEAEQQLRQLLGQKCQPEDVKAFVHLQTEIMEGRVTQEARELLYAQLKMCAAEREAQPLLAS